MKKWISLMVVANVLVAWGTTAVFATDDVEFGLGADFLSKYVWRGQNLVDGWVLQPLVTAGCKGFTGSAWGNFDLTEENNNKGEFTEVDLTLDYSAAFPGLEALGYSVGFIYYDFPVTGGADDTFEIYYGLTLDTIASPSVTIYHDVDEADGTYISLGVAHTLENAIEIAPDTPVSIDLGATLGWGSAAYNKFYWGLDDSKLNDLVLSASFPLQVAGWTVAPRIDYITLVSDNIRRTDAYGKDSDFFVVGAGISKRF
jgi:hypothetical protein